MSIQDQPENTFTKREFLAAGVKGTCAFCVARFLGGSRRAAAQTAQKGLIRTIRSPWFSPAEDNHIRCGLCPVQCDIAPGGRGRCLVRENRDGTGHSLVYGNPALVQLDPIERKPLFHVLPGSRSLSVSTAGCNIECKFCEVWDMALVAPEEVHAYDMPPEMVVQQAEKARARSVSYAFGEPVVFYEYMKAIGTLAKEAGLLSVMHSNGYINPEPLKALCPVLDAVNIDFKSFDPAFYRDVCDGELKPVLDTLRLLKEEGVHIELTNLIIPTLNDDMDRIREMCLWIKNELGEGVPIHFARFYPLYKLANLPPTPVSTLDEARATAFEAGLSYVYIANVTGHEGENTFCPQCKEIVIKRLGFVIEEEHIQDGNCGHCGHALPGIWS